MEVVLVNARDAKTVPGRKTDVNDAQWIQRLHEHGLLRASFRPHESIVALRTYLRHRERMVEFSASHIQHIQKARMQMNLQLHHVVSDITGATGMKIIRAILPGTHNPATLAKFRDVRSRAAEEIICQALKGNFRAEQLFALRQAVELYDTYQAKIADCDIELELALGELNAEREVPTASLLSNRATSLPRIVAVNVGKTSTALGGFYRRLGERIGKATAVTATTRKICITLLQHAAIRNGIQRSWGRLLRGALPRAHNRQSAPSCQRAGIQPRRFGACCGGSFLGSVFCNAELRAVIRALDQIDILTRARHPESNGIVKRGNGTVRQESEDYFGDNYLIAQRKVKQLVDEYKYVRLHATLGYFEPRKLHFGKPSPRRADRTFMLLSARHQRRA